MIIKLCFLKYFYVFDQAMQDTKFWNHILEVNSCFKVYEFEIEFGMKKNLIKPKFGQVKKSNYGSSLTIKNWLILINISYMQIISKDYTISITHFDMQILF